MLIPSSKVNFIHVPKAAGSSIGKCLRDNLVLSSKDKEVQKNFTKFSSQKGFPFPNHAPAAVKREFLGESNYQKYLNFSFVRNPFSLLVSLYEYTHQTEKKIFNDNGWELNKFQKNILDNSFEDWVLNFPTGRCQSDMLLSEAGELLVNFIGKTENYGPDSSKVFKMLGIDVKESVVVNGTEHENYKDYYTGKTKVLVQKRYNRAFQLFGYEF